MCWQLDFDDNLEIVELERGKHSWYKLIDAFGRFIMYQHIDSSDYILYRYEPHKNEFIQCYYYCKKIPQPVLIPHNHADAGLYGALNGALYFDLSSDKFVLSDEIIRNNRKSSIRTDDSYSLYDAFENDSDVLDYLNN